MQDISEDLVPLIDEDYNPCVEFREGQRGRVDCKQIGELELATPPLTGGIGCIKLSPVGRIELPLLPRCSAVTHRGEPVANILNLNANNGNQVGSAQKVSILTGEPNTWLFIYSGIAQQDQYAEGDGGFLGLFPSSTETDATVNVTLDNISGVLLEFATTAGINEIYVSGSLCDYGINSTSLSLQSNGDLILTASVYVVGTSAEGAGFSGLSYYVSAKIILDAATITGTIRWVKTLAVPLASTHFVITANTELPPAPGSLFGNTLLEATGLEGALNSADDTYYYVPYTITVALLGKTVTVVVDPIPGGFSGAPQDGNLSAQQISGPTSISLTSANRHATDVDFEMDFEPAPK
jgi:hypothetical protein